MKRYPMREKRRGTVIRMQTVNVFNPASGFIKMFNQEIAEKLVASGFSYAKEGDTFVFCATPDLLAALAENYSDEEYVIESKLRF